MTHYDDCDPEELEEDDREEYEIRKKLAQILADRVGAKPDKRDKWKKK